MKVLVLTGPESSGKSWLAEQLQARFGGRVVGEYVRHFIDEQRRDTCYADIPAIARGQLAWEDAARAERPALLILDTHLLSNILWSRILFGACPDWLEPALLRRRYDLHLLLSPEGVAWSADGQRCQPELAQRQAIELELENDLRELHFGAWEGRSAAALMDGHSEALGRFWADPYAFTPPGGEPLSEFEARVLAAQRRLRQRHAGRRVLLVTHGGVIRLLLACARGLPRERLLQVDVGHGALFGLRAGEGDDRWHECREGE